MPRIKIDSDQFPNIVMSYLFDKLLHPNEVSAGNEEFTDMMIKLKPRLLPITREMYLGQPGDLKIKYKLIKDAFRGDDKMNGIFIVSPDEAKEEDPGIIKKIINKVIKAIKSSNEFSTKEVDYLKEALDYDDDVEVD